MRTEVFFLYIETLIVSFKDSSFIFNVNNNLFMSTCEMKLSTSKR